MFERVKLQKLNDFFLTLGERPGKGVYFERLNSYAQGLEEFVQTFYDVARKGGVVIEGKIPNPDEKNLAYYSEIMGMDFQMDPGFINRSLKKWLPRMKDQQREQVASALYDSLDTMRKAGKNDNMLKNAYIKYMCWLYYKFERIVNSLGEENLPKILYEGTISHYELMLISILSNAGCDVLLLQYRGDAEYLKLDPAGSLSDEIRFQSSSAFPENFSLKKIREDLQTAYNNERLYGPKPSLTNCTNAWLPKCNGLEDIQIGVAGRGNDPKLFYNCFYRINGVEDKLTYANELYQFQLEIKNYKRKIAIVSEQIEKPRPEEIAQIRRGNYTKIDQMISDLSRNIQYSANAELQRLMVKAFVDLILEASKNPETNLNKLTNKAIYLLCWLRRYQGELFQNWRAPEIGCFVYLGGCKDSTESMFVRMLSRLPVDVVILCPNLNQPCCLTDSSLLEINYRESLIMTSFPTENSRLQIGTVAYHAERELDEMMYQGTGIYRSQQYTKANVINLQTMYEEIKILWDQELKYRPNFSAADGVVSMPVIFAKISGIKDGDQAKYWVSIRELMTQDTIVVTNLPYIQRNAPNPIRASVTDLFKNGRLQKEKIKNHPQFAYNILREEMQDFMLDKLQWMIDNKVIKGIGENGTEYTVVAVALNLPQNVIRMIQKFDFTKKNPKLIYVNPTETIISLEDAITLAFLNAIGFDVVFFIPTGYQNVEKHYNQKLMEEHQIGEYVYDLTIPDLNSIEINKRPSLRDIFFRRGN